MIRRRMALSLLAVSLIVGQLNCNGSRQSGFQAPPGSRSQPRFKPGFNLFSPDEDVRYGHLWAQQFLTKNPMLDDPEIDSYIKQLGAKLASKAAGERFPYQFRVLATREDNASAFPGGFLFVNAGAIKHARNEGELAGAMAHEIAHAALRHSTNEMSKDRLAEYGLGILRRIAEAGEDSDLGESIFGIGTLGKVHLFLKYRRAQEKEADLEGARIMVEAGYDPRDMANYFERIEETDEQGGQRLPEMLSKHPNPGNRTKYITKEISRLPFSPNPVHTTPEFEAVKARVIELESSLSEESGLKRIGKDPADIELGVRPPRPSAQSNGYQSNDGSFAVQVPANWDEHKMSESELIFAPNGAYGKYKGEPMVTHGIFIGVRNVSQPDLQSATRAFVQQQIESNQDFQIVHEPQQIDIGGQKGYYAVISGPSAVTGVVEVDETYTTITADGRMFYIITIAPEDEAGVYRPAFEKIIDSLRLAR